MGLDLNEEIMLNDSLALPKESLQEKINPAFDAENKIIAVVGSVSGANGSLGRVKVAR